MRKCERDRAAPSGCPAPATTSGSSLAEQYGTAALMPKTRRRVQLPNATPTHVIEQLA